MKAYLELAEDRAKMQIPLAIGHWLKGLDKCHEFEECNAVQNAGKINAIIAKAHAKSEFEEYRIIQDRFIDPNIDKGRIVLEIDLRMHIKSKKCDE